MQIFIALGAFVLSHEFIFQTIGFSSIRVSFVAKVLHFLRVQSVAKSFRAQAKLFFMKSVAIIGAGITGLTAEFYLKRQGVPVTVYEAGGRVGGVIQSIRKDGFLAEFRPNTILETSPKIA